MGIWEIGLIFILCIIFLDPKEIKILINNISNFVINLNKYINSVKEYIIKSINIDNKN